MSPAAGNISIGLALTGTTEALIKMFGFSAAVASLLPERERCRAYADLESKWTEFGLPGSFSVSQLSPAFAASIISVPPSPRKVTLSVGGQTVEIGEDFIRWQAKYADRFPVCGRRDEEWNAFRGVCRAWVAEHPEPEDAMSAHTFTIHSIEEGNVCGEFECHHDSADWLGVDESGDALPLGECWLKSWWDGLGSELLNLQGLNLTLPVAPSEAWTWGDGGVIVHAPEGGES